MRSDSPKDLIHIEQVPINVAMNAAHAIAG